MEKGLVVAGQVVGMLKDLPSVKQLIPRMIEDAAETLGRNSGFVVA